MTEAAPSLPAILHFEHVLPRDRFLARASETSDPQQWTTVKVEVFDLNHSRFEPIYTYGRNYSMLKTFEPFRLFDGEDWRYYALISPRYTGLQVLDLESLEIVAERAAPQMSPGQAQLYNERLQSKGEEPRCAAGDPDPASGFCPMELHVPDVLDIYDDQSLVSPITASRITGSVEDEIESRVDCVRTFLDKRTFGFVAGCQWGDDWSTKVETVSLEGFTKTGVLAPGPDLGYFVLPERVPLSRCYGENYFLEGEWPCLELAAPVSFEIVDNAVKSSRLYGSELTSFEPSKS